MSVYLLYTRKGGCIKGKQTSRIRLRSSEIFLELSLLRYRAKGRNEQNVEGDNNIYIYIFISQQL
jgi:hypothetical protein